jgi:hypothetical protein
MRVFAAIVGLWAGVLFASPLMAHDSWISQGGLKNHAGEWCCGEGDCAVLDEGSVAYTARGYEVHGSGTISSGRRCDPRTLRRDRAGERGAALSGRDVLALQAAGWLAPLLLRAAAEYLIRISETKIEVI